MKDERCLRLIQNDKLSSYEELLEKYGSVSVYHRNIQSLAIEMLQIKHGQSHECVTDIFTQETQDLHRKHGKHRKHRISEKIEIVGYLL